jgi:hypothetical protein
LFGAATGRRPRGTASINAQVLGIVADRTRASVVLSVDGSPWTMSSRWAMKWPPARSRVKCSAMP